ncbi:MAG: sulfite exporter TauE/SafE family protein [Microthrixaceae bacterium]
MKLRRPHSPTDVGVGLMSGMFKTSVGISGPPIVILLQGRGLAKTAFRATSASVIVAVNVVSLGLFAVTGRFDRLVIAAALVSLPALPLGYWLGDRMHARVPEERFRYLVLAMVVLSAGLAMYGAIA